MVLLHTRLKLAHNITLSFFGRYSPNYMYDKDTYPNYLSGTGYVMSVDVALRLYNASLRIPLFHLEDVFVTGNKLSRMNGGVP